MWLTEARSQCEGELTEGNSCLPLEIAGRDALIVSIGRLESHRASQFRSWGSRTQNEANRAQSCHSH